MKTKKLHSLLLAGVMTCSMLVPATAFAASSYTNSTASVTNESYTTDTSNAACTVDAEVASEFSVTIPKTITLNGDTKSADYTVSVSGDIAGDEYILVKPEASFAMKQSGKDDVTATVTQNKNALRDANSTIVLGENETKIGSNVQGTVSAQGLTAGRWSGAFNFEIALKNN